MFRLATLFLLVALGAAFVGFGEVEGFSWGGARIFAMVFFVLSALYFATWWWNKPYPVANSRQ